MPKDQNRGFNPLDILATAAALQSEDKPTADSERDMTQQTELSVTGKRNGNPHRKESGSKPKVEIRKIKVVTVCSDLEKMFDEHNYGNSRKISIKPSDSCSTDDLASTKERKVIVTVVDKSGDHRVVKTFNSAKLLDDKGVDTPSSGSGDSFGENLVTKLGESIKISCGEKIVNNSTLVQTVAEGDNSVIPQVNKDLLDQVRLFTSTTQVNNDKNSPQDINELSCTGEELINATSNCQEQTDGSQSKETTCDTCSEQRKEKVDVFTSEARAQILSTETDGRMGQKLKVNRDVSLGDIQTKDSVTNCKTTGDSEKNNVDNNAEFRDDAIQSDVQGRNTVENLVSNHPPEITSSKARAEVQLSQSGQPVSNIANVSDGKSISTSKGENSVCDSTLSDNEEINTHNGEEGRESSDMISGKKEAGEISPKTQLYDEDSASETCENRSNDTILMSPLGKYTNPMECGSCLDELEGTQNWHYEGEPGRSDVRLSIDLDSPKSEKQDIKNDEINKTHVDDLGPHDTAKTSHLSSFNDDTLSAVSDRKCYFDDHCYADFSSQRRTEQNSQSFTEDDTPYGSSSDLSQDSGISDISPSPNTKEIHIDVCGLSDSGIKPSLTIGGKPVLLADSSLLPLLQMKCNKEGLAGLSEINRTRDAIIALVQSNDGNVLQTVKQKPQLSPVASVSPPKKDTSPRFGKYRIGTFASVSNSAMGLESPKRQSVTKGSGHKTATSLLSNLSLINAQGKSREAGHGTERKSGNQSSPHTHGRKPYRSHIDHDHDYCLVQEYETIVHRGGKDGNTKRAKEKKQDGHEKKTKKNVSSDIDKSDFDDSLDSFPFEDSSQPASPSLNHSHGTRQKLKSSEKIADYVKSGCSDSKLKITGSFQDDFIYFLNTKSRSRRRTLSQDIPMPVPADRILLPLPKPGDIVVPHLTDADLEAIKQGHPSAAKPMQRYPVTSTVQAMPTAPKTEGTSTISHTKSHSEVSDEENKIINTILSMETGEPLSSQSSVDAPSFLDQGMLPAGSGDGLLSNINLTPEQMEIIYHAMDEVQSLSPDVSTVDTKFDVDSELSKSITKTQTEGSGSEDRATNNAHLTPTPSSSLSETKIIDSEDSTVTSTLPASKSSLPNNNTNSSLSSSESNNPGVLEPSTLDIGSSALGTNHSNVPTSSSFAGPGVVNTMPDISFTPLDKSSLDIFGNDLKLFPEASVDPTGPVLATDTNNSYPTASGNFTNVDNSAPWIVTVSMYWNDLPAIMIDKLPYVRLVDIHKQILPAKDTGILKKRCQLLSIPVLNCTEMQRYFLVQYGKAFNSKSTLIIGKDDAKMLIGYYVNPASVPTRVKEYKTTTERLHEVSKDPVSSPAKLKWSPLLKQKLETPHSIVEPQSDSKALQNEFVSAKQTTNTEVTGAPSTETTLPPVVQKSQIAAITSSVVPTEPTKLSSRTRHKKINFLEMLKGDSNNNTAGTDVTVIEGPIEQNYRNDKVPKASRMKDRKNSPESRSKTQESSDSRPKNEKQKHRPSSDESVQVEMNTCDSESENNVTIVGKRKARWESNIDNSQIAKSFAKDKKKTTPLKVKWTMFSKKNSKRSPNAEIKTDSKEILAVVHKDMSPKNGQRGRVQAGNVFIDMYDGPNVPCVRCCTCKKLFSVDSFLKHLHEIGGSGKLLIVTQPQTFALRDSHPSESQKKLWGSFQKRRRLYNAEVRAKNSVTTEVKKSVVVDEGLVTKIQSSLMKNRNVRISARKRKPKQLHPIENYSFAKSTVTNQRCNELAETDENFAAVDNVPSPAKIARILPNLTANVQAVSKNTEESTNSIMTESVVTLTNGPEVISFTALENGFDV